MARFRIAPLALALAALTPAAQAQAPEKAADTALKDVVVTATRTEADAHTVPATITSVTREEADRRLPADAPELFEDEPDVAYGRDLRRFGATRPNIRGIEDNRVVQMVDGIRMPSFYNGGGPTNFTMNAPLGPSLEFLRRAEVLRGPASSLYGSDAIGGVVGYLTFEPGDLLARGEALGARARLGYNGANDGATDTLLGAGRSESLEWLLGYTHTNAHEFGNQGDVGGSSASRTQPNPQDIRDRGALARFALQPAAGHKLALALEARDVDVEVQVLRLASSLPKVTAMSGDDHGTRVRGSLDWEHKPQAGWYDRLSARLYYQSSETNNFNYQTRTNTSATCSAAAGTGNDCQVRQQFVFEQNAAGATLQLESALGRHHLLTYGADLSRVRTEELRDAWVLNQTTGTTSKSLAGDTFPLRDFAPGYTDTVGAFIQDEIVGLAGGRLTLTPGLRYDWRSLEPEVDALSQGVLTAIGRQAVSQTDSAFSPKLAAAWQFTPVVSAYGLLVRGFRAPNYEEVNGHFRNTAQSYGISPNPNLKPETSNGVEAGLRWNRPGLRAQLAVYDNHYRDFISSQRLNCPADPNCIAGLTTTYMSVNLSQVRIYGAEARLAWEFTPGWRVEGAIAYAHGTDESANQPLDTVEPARLFLALARDAGSWGAEARLRAAAEVKRVNDYSGGVYTPWFRPPGYEVLDLGAWWHPGRRVRFSVALNNLFDEKYWLWSDIRTADARNPVGVDFYSQPGRSAAARVEFAL
jgi:hemoglobin/transferrin/lactoferrin receptor protein